MNLIRAEKEKTRAKVSLKKKKENEVLSPFALRQDKIQMLQQGYGNQALCRMMGVDSQSPIKTLEKERAMSLAREADIGEKIPSVLGKSEETTEDAMEEEDTGLLAKEEKAEDLPAFQKAVLVPNIPKFQYYDSWTDWIAAVDNAIINFFNGFIDIANGAIADAQYIAKNGVISYLKKSYSSLKEIAIQIDKGMEEEIAYIKNTPIDEQVQGILKLYQNPQYWEQILTIATAAIVNKKMPNFLKNSKVSNSKTKNLLGKESEKNIKKVSKPGKNLLNELLSKAEKIIDKDGKIRLEMQLDNGSKVVFRRNIGDQAHPIRPKYPYPVDHYNVEIHIPAKKGGYKIKENVHIILDNDGNVVESYFQGKSKKQVSKNSRFQKNTLKKDIQKEGNNIKLDILEEFAESQNKGIRTGLPEGTHEIRDQVNVRISTTAKHSEILSENMKRYGLVKPGTGYEAHHIVPQSDPRAAKLREFLEKKEINIDCHDNGVWLPKNTTTRNIGGEYLHEFTQKTEYFEKLEELILADPKASEKKIRSILQEIARQLQEGKF